MLRSRFREYEEEKLRFSACCMQKNAIFYFIFTEPRAHHKVHPCSFIDGAQESVFDAPKLKDSKIPFHCDAEPPWKKNRINMKSEQDVENRRVMRVEKAYLLGSTGNL